MVKYVIKKHYTPTETNQGAVEHDWFTGKAEFEMNTESASHGDLSKNELWDCAYCLEHAYTRKCDAVKALNRAKESCQWEEKYGHWLVTAEIIEVEG